MNVCAVRTVLEYGGAACSYMMLHEWKPHEPMLYRGHPDKSLDNTPLIVVHPHNTAQNLYRCHHCGCIYSEDL